MQCTFKLSQCITVTAMECLSSEFECRSGERCISLRKHCDGIYNCFDFSDEDNCLTGN